MRAEFVFQPAHNITLSVCFRRTAVTGQRVPAKRIIRLCAEEFDVHPDEMVGARRHRNIAYARFAAWDLLRRHTKLSYPSIGQKFGNRDHSTVMGGVDRSADLLADPDETWYTEAFRRVQKRLLV